MTDTEKHPRARRTVETAQRVRVDLRDGDRLALTKLQAATGIERVDDLVRYALRVAADRTVRALPTEGDAPDGIHRIEVAS
jgi:hypothetical protein